MKFSMDRVGLLIFLLVLSSIMAGCKSGLDRTDAKAVSDTFFSRYRLKGLATTRERNGFWGERSE